MLSLNILLRWARPWRRRRREEARRRRVLPDPCYRFPFFPFFFRRCLGGVAVCLGGCACVTTCCAGRDLRKASSSAFFSKTSAATKGASSLDACFFAVSMAFSSLPKTVSTGGAVGLRTFDC